MPKPKPTTVADTAAESADAAPAPADEGTESMEGFDPESIELPDEARQLVEDLLAERDEAVAGRQRALADFVNYQRRVAENESRIRFDAVSEVLRTLLPVIDNIDITLSQNQDQITTEQIMDGVRMVRTDLTKALERNSVRVIDPIPMTEFDPSQHQAVMKEHTDRQPSQTIVAVLQVGYAIDEKILRPAAVTVAAPLEEGV